MSDHRTFNTRDVLAQLETAFMALHELGGRLDGTIADDLAFAIGEALGAILKAKRLAERQTS